MTDLLTFGETMLRLSVPTGERLARADEFDVHVGGAESNVAVAASRLGLDAGWLSALPDTDVGRRVVYDLDAEGVTTHVSWHDEGRVGTYYLEAGTEPRGSEVVYDRTGTPIRSATPEDLPVDAVTDAAAFFTSGITPALSQTAAKTAAALLSRASDAGATTAMDMNYRAKLWDPTQARTTLAELFSSVDVLFVARRDAKTVFEVDAPADETARRLRDEYDFELVVVTRGEDGALAVDADDTVVEQGAYETETVDPVGSGDAFVGGFLARWLDDGAVADALAYGAATAALKRTLDGDVALVSPTEVERVVESGAGGITR